jgi:hypothetical protein
MQNQEIIKIIENLKGRKNYEEKRASKLGFPSLYAYFENKIQRKKKVLEDKKKELEELNDHSKLKDKDKSKQKKNCSCC